VLNAGPSVSVTVTVNEQVAVLPAASVAAEVTVVVPTGNTLPDAGTELTVTPGQLSVAVGEKLTTAPQSPVVLPVVIFAGQVTTGGCTSLTRTVNVQAGPENVLAVTVVIPTGKKEPEAWLSVIGPQAPLVCGAGKVTVAPH
jgi:hypothetical protein